MFLVDDDYRIALLEAEAAFITAFLCKIEDPESGWSEPWQEYHASRPGDPGPKQTPPAA